MDENNVDSLEERGFLQHTYPHHPLPPPLSIMEIFFERWCDELIPLLLFSPSWSSSPPPTWIARHETRTRSLRTPSNMLVLNLAVSDLLMNSKAPVFIYNSFHLYPKTGWLGEWVLSSKHRCRDIGVLIRIKMRGKNFRSKFSIKKFDENIFKKSKNLKIFFEQMGAFSPRLLENFLTLFLKLFGQISSI